MRQAELTAVLVVAMLMSASASTPSAAVPRNPSAVPACCPTEAAYEADVQAFVHGNQPAALIAIAHAPPDQLMRAATHMGGHDRQLFEGAMALHLLLAERALDANQFDEVFLQLRASSNIFLKFRAQSYRQSDLLPEVVTFLGTWINAATELWVASGDFSAATSVVIDGLNDDALHDRVLLSAGIVEEAAGALDERRAADVTAFGATSTNTNLLLRRGATVHLNRAEHDDRDALSLNRTRADEATLRLGRVLALEGKDKEAQTVLQRAAANHEPRIVYLAHLFLADLAVREKAMDAAAGEYQAALAVDPVSRIARIGLSNVDQRIGDGGRARAEILEWSRHVATSEPDAFRLYEMGIDQLEQQLEQLVSEIVR
jgi:tetratricopeptide (TPR) repeat protein